MKPDLCPFVCHSSGFHVISFEYLLRSQSRYRFIRLSHACSVDSACVGLTATVHQSLSELGKKKKVWKLWTLSLMHSSSFAPPLTTREHPRKMHTASSSIIVQTHQTICGPCSSHNRPWLNPITCFIIFMPYLHIKVTHWGGHLRWQTLAQICLCETRLHMSLPDKLVI